MKLNLGCGSNIREGFINIDLESPHAVKIDLRQPLPYQRDSIELIFSEHFIEHVAAHYLKNMAFDWFRVLKPGSWVRLSTPDLMALVDNYRMDLVRAYLPVGWEPRTPAEMMNDGMRLWGHEFLYDWPELSALLTAAGFVNVTRERPRHSQVPELAGLEIRPDCGDLVVQAMKPA